MSNHKSKIIQVFLPPEVAALIAAQAQAEGVSVSGLIRQLCCVRANATNFWAITQSKRNNALAKGAGV
jgi:hypothetical protein